jgi:glycosyltransferase involved in cell wall biosynthesis
MEAMSMGLPCVVPNVGELSEFVVHGQNGFLVDDGSPEEFSRHILTLLQSDTIRREFGARARLTADLFTVEAIAKRWDRILGAPLTNAGPSCVNAARSDGPERHIE